MSNRKKNRKKSKKIKYTQEVAQIYLFFMVVSMFRDSTMIVYYIKIRNSAITISQLDAFSSSSFSAF